MAEALKNQFGADVPQAIARMILAVHPSFNSEGFVRVALQGYDALALMARGKKIAQALRVYLPPDYAQALAILVNSLDQPHGRDRSQSLASFIYLPHTVFVSAYGLAHFEASMLALHDLTQRFTGEFAIRAFIEQDPAATLRQLTVWATDPSVHVRRLVSEGTRPRLPWAGRLRLFQADPAPVLALLELLKDDPELYVRRSVANNLNDIGKDHPDVLTRTAHDWLQHATPQRTWIVQHALRSAIKRGETGALDALGFGDVARVRVVNALISPRRAVPGGSVHIAFEVTSTAVGTDESPQRVMVDFGVHYVKANGRTRVKVFKLKTLELSAGQTVGLSKKISLAQMSTRQHYPGIHKVDVILNGQAQPLGEFELTSS
jgi:3-methyladenine DNA glycosylase AlkC